MLNFTWWVNRKDCAGTQYLSGRLPRPGQHRRLRSQRAAADRRLSSTRPTARAGWRCTSLNLMRIALELANHDHGLRGHRDQVLRALPPHRRSDDNIGRQASACGTRRTGSTTTCSTCRTADGAAQGAVDGRADPAVCGGNARSGALAQVPEFTAAPATGFSTTGPISQASSRDGTSPAAENAGCCRCFAGTG